MEELISRASIERSRDYGFVDLSPASYHLDHYASSLGLTEADAIQALAGTLSFQLGADDRSDPEILVVKPPRLILLQCRDLTAMRQLIARSRALDSSCRDLFYVDPISVNQLCQRLASGLIERLGYDEVSRASFSYIPRGGVHVLDQLVSALALKEDQLSPQNDPDRLLIVVDDCSISGVRFKQFLDGCQSQRIVFAHLYSHPDLREAITTRESRVLACVSAGDLHNRFSGTTLLPAHEQSLPARIESVECYWVGLPEALCFPWNEPDRSFWNPVTGRQERAWKIVPPELCSKNRPSPGTTPVPIQIQPEGRGPLRPSQRAIFGELDGSIVLCDLVTGRCVGLEGVAADLWRALLVHGRPEAVASALQAEYDVPVKVLREDARNFFEDLEARGLIEWTEPA